MAAVERVGASGRYILGEEVSAFETALAAFWGLNHAVGVGNGMDALEIGLRCLGLARGEKVLTSPLSAFATTLAIIRAGGTPVFADVNSLGGLDLQQCRDVIKKDRSIRFLVPVHLYGIALDMEALKDLKEEFDLKIVEDCAQAIGASDHGIRVGEVGQAAATSFYPTKNLGALGDAGALLTSDPVLAQKARALRNYGQTSPCEHSESGLNSRLDELHAAILRDAFLPNLPAWTQARRKIARRYQESLNHPAIETPRPPAASKAVWHLFPVIIAHGLRDNLKKHLRSAGIMTGIHYPHIIPDQAALSAHGGYQGVADPMNARRFAAGELSLPIHPFLGEQEVDAIVEACREWKP